MKHQKQSDKVAGGILQALGVFLMIFGLSLIYSDEESAVAATMLIGLVFFLVGSSVKDTWHE